MIEYEEIKWFREDVDSDQYRCVEGGAVDQFGAKAWRVVERILNIMNKPLNKLGEWPGSVAGCGGCDDVACRPYDAALRVR
jgi:hypothetical protein